MLCYTPMQRITAKNAISHRYLRDISLDLPPVTELFSIK